MRDMLRKVMTADLLFSPGKSHWWKLPQNHRSIQRKGVGKEWLDNKTEGVKRDTEVAVAKLDVI
jgi:hypothetical protein